MTGDPFAPSMQRWRIFQNRYFSVYVHRFLRDDAERVMHDHPWRSVSWILEGGYSEITPEGVFIRTAGQVLFRSASHKHRIEVTSHPAGGAVTLFLVGKKTREWGFWCNNEFYPNKRFQSMNQDELREAGCNE